MARTITSTDSPTARLNAMIGRFDPAIQKVVRAARTKLRKRLPTAVELVYDNYNALAIAFASSERRGDWILSLAVYAKGVNLYFIYGIALRSAKRRAKACTPKRLSALVRRALSRCRSLQCTFPQVVSNKS